MISFQELKSTNPLYSFIEKLWLESFIQEERREVVNQRNNCDNNPLFHCCLLKNNLQSIGFLNYWTFNNFCYIEHFAITPQEQNKNYGKKALSAFLEFTKQPIILEIEIPKEEDLNTLRRQAFYTKLGFSVYNKDYLQPPYRSTDSYLPLLLMKYGELNPTITFKEIKQDLYKEVYNKIL